MDKNPKKDILEIMDSFAEELYNMANPEDQFKTKTLAAAMPVFELLMDYMVKRAEVVEKTGAKSGGMISAYQRTLESKDSSAAPNPGSGTGRLPSASRGILDQIGRKKGKTPRLPSDFDGADGDSDGVSSGQPSVSLNGGGLHTGPDGHE